MLFKIYDRIIRNGKQKSLFIVDIVKHKYS
jgi:hypothetical protein